MLSELIADESEQALCVALEFIERALARTEAESEGQSSCPNCRCSITDDSQCCDTCTFACLGCGEIGWIEDAYRGECGGEHFCRLCYRASFGGGAVRR